MVQSQFSLAWDSYKSSICSGFSALQQNGEFVDMTIAADGHYVKVHQVLVALASPYLKDLITSAPCQHPVIFLNNVTHRSLCLLLEYIYTGEVVVPADCFSSFAETAKSLHIRGLENIGTANSLPVKMSVNMPQLDDAELCHVSGTKRITVPSTDKDHKHVSLPAAARKIFIRHDPSTPSKVISSNSSFNTSSSTPQDDHHDYTDLMDDSGAQDDDDDDWKVEDSSKNREVKDKPSSNLQFTVSIRGSLQVILNRYIYNLHSTTSRSGLRRWRCVDYRNNKCSAFVVTRGNVVLNRANLHNHSFHDKKILAKIEKKAVYSAIDEVEGYKDLPMEGQGHFLSLEEFGDDIKPKSTDTDSSIKD